MNPNVKRRAEKNLNQISINRKNSENQSSIASCTFDSTFRSSFIFVLIVLIFRFYLLKFHKWNHMHIYLLFHLIVELFLYFFFGPAETDSHFPRTACKYSCKIAIGILCLIFFSVCLHTPLRSARTNVFMWWCKKPPTKLSLLRNFNFPSTNVHFLLCLPFGNKQNFALLLKFFGERKCSCKMRPEWNASRRISFLHFMSSCNWCGGFLTFSLSLSCIFDVHPNLLQFFPITFFSGETRREQSGWI